MSKVITTDHVRRLLEDARGWQKEPDRHISEMEGIRREYGLSEGGYGAGVLYVLRRLAEIAESDEGSL